MEDNSQDIINEFAKDLKRIRMEKGYRTQKDFAFSIGLRPSTYGGYEAGVKIPREDKLIKISEALDYDFRQLLHSIQKGDKKETIDSTSQKKEKLNKKDVVAIPKPEYRNFSDICKKITEFYILWTKKISVIDEFPVLQYYLEETSYEISLHGPNFISLKSNSPYDNSFIQILGPPSFYFLSHGAGLQLYNTIWINFNLSEYDQAKLIPSITNNFDQIISSNPRLSWLYNFQKSFNL
ncbi:helix-turn-helix domain-containing protein [Cytobacillus firmus]|uniref:helix-turn-helix domain-containing protein n=1 Tax=Cytobacillus firmus TaxID=1399 RepID=UPI0018CFECEE|nr:helix-turn-helix transcriptional regulator [Cytobacillus firmus]